MMPLYKGTEGSYDLLRKLGEGGNGEVWSANGPRGEVAIKLLKKARSAPSDAADRFLREIAALRKLASVKGILPLLDADGDPASSPRPWFAMPLATVMRMQLGSAAGLQAVCLAVSDLAGALARVHAQGVVHRDIKPDNLYWYDGQWCLGDFGLADFQDAEPLTRSDKKLGPAHYIASEMLNNPSKSDGRAADIYSLGKTLWVLATGQNYPLPGVHDPTFSGAAITSYCDDSRAAMLDELLRRMTLLDPTRRPAADIVSAELAILGQEQKIEPSPDPTSSLNRLRAVLVPHLTREEEQTRQRKRAEMTFAEVFSAVESIVGRINTQAGLQAQRLWSNPETWGFQPELGDPRIVWENYDGYSFEAGGSVNTWRLGIAVKCQLLSDDSLVMCVGYSLDSLSSGRITTAMGSPNGWKETHRAPNGTPSGEAMKQRLIAELNSNLSSVLDQFARLVEQASK